ncbi:hypothetical protein TNCV_3202721 [Trichonephila clavipes]|nr:hypothetical protein TNCV_3202721 [Trichonephila clavipes]
MDQIESQPNEEMLSLESPPSPSLLASNGLLFNTHSSNEVQPHIEVEPSNTELVQQLVIRQIMDHPWTVLKFTQLISISTICLSVYIASHLIKSFHPSNCKVLVNM